LPDILSLTAAALIVVKIATSKEIFMHWKYLAVIALLVFSAIAGIVLNDVAAGTVVTGLRTHFKYLPFFLVPAVYKFSDEEIKGQLKFLLVLALLQLPIVLYQRFVQYAGVNSGDPISGTLVISSILSLFLVSTIAILLAFHLKRRVGFTAFAIMLLVLFIPTTLNETKGTLIFLPLAMIIPTLLFLREKHNLSASGPILALAGVLVVGFVAAYNLHLGRSESGVELKSFIAEGSYKDYLYKDAEGRSGETIGKVDSYVLAYKTLSSDWTKLMFGLGIGNITQQFSKTLTGAYADRYAHMDPNRTALAFLLWEMGIFGVAFLLILCFLVFDDARRLRSADSAAGALGLGWVAISVVFVISLAYKNVLTFNVIGYLFWYLSGQVAASQFRRAWAAKYTHSTAVAAVPLGGQALKLSANKETR